MQNNTNHTKIPTHGKRPRDVRAFFVHFGRYAHVTRERAGEGRGGPPLCVIVHVSFTYLKLHQLFHRVRQSGLGREQRKVEECVSALFRRVFALHSGTLWCTVVHTAVHTVHTVVHCGALCYTVAYAVAHTLWCKCCGALPYKCLQRGGTYFALHHRLLGRALYLFQFDLFRPKVFDQGLGAKMKNVKATCERLQCECLQCGRLQCLKYVGVDAVVLATE